MKFLLLSAALCLVTSCRTIATPASQVSHAAPRLGARARTWEVRRNGEALGLVVLFQKSGRVSDSVYVVRNPWQQDLGLIDGLGRAFRYVPHREEPTWVGSGTVLTGALAILDVHDSCEMVELDEDEVRPVPGSSPSILTETAGNTASERIPEPSDTPSSDGGLPQSR